MSVPEHLWRHPTAAAIASLARRLDVPNEPGMQDWEYEIADPARIDEYLSLYHDDALTDDERFTLMETILQAFEDLPGELTSDPRWAEVLTILNRHIDLHTASVWYWAHIVKDHEEESWRISPWLRTLVAAHSARLNPKGDG